MPIVDLPGITSLIIARDLEKVLSGETNAEVIADRECHIDVPLKPENILKIASFPSQEFWDLSGCHLWGEENKLLENLIP